jgi:hypothetical protein
MRHVFTQTIVIGKAFFQIVHLWMNTRNTLPKDHKAESSEYPRGFHQARPGTITASHDEVDGVLQKPQ